MNQNLHASALDPDELLHLAIHASQTGDFHAAIGYLKELLSQDPAHAGAIYFLATQHAEIGLYERAISGMQQAIELDASLDTARFQLGLLFLQQNQVDGAKGAFEGLLNVTQDPALSHFARAYQALIDERQADAREALAQGVAVCDHNLPLKADMIRVAASLTTTEGEASATPSTLDNNLSNSMHFLGAYRNTDDHNDSN